MKIERAHIIINPASGQPKPVLHTINSIFHAAGVDWKITITKHGGDAHRSAQEAVAAGVDVIAVYGGDGTVMEVASGLIGTGAPMAILPGGTANVVSVELGIPKNLPEACKLIVNENNSVRAIDVGFSEGKYFLHRVGLGMSAEKVKGATRELKDRFGILAYTIAGLNVLKDPPMAHYHFTLDGETIEADGISCIVANSGNMGMQGFSMAKTVSISDGLLDVFLVRDRSIVSIASSAASVADLTLNTDALQHWQARDITIDATPPQSTQGDGEVWDNTPIRISVLPHAVNVIVSPPA
ncbi:MAG TPA: diacylglycerol kinase family lipid kinase [Caldilineae bacterium]|nr:diacylglycerol kinase family lipid kinase [Caldilineae bacterium]